MLRDLAVVVDVRIMAEARFTVLNAFISNGSVYGSVLSEYGFEHGLGNKWYSQG